MIVFKVIKNKYELEKYFLFHHKIAKRLNFNFKKDEYDNLKYSKFFIALKNNEICASVRLIKKFKKRLLPIEKYYDISLIKKRYKKIFEFSQLLFDTSLSKEWFINFLMYVLNYIKNKSHYILLLVNTKSDNSFFVNSLYKYLYLKGFFTTTITPQKELYKQNYLQLISDKKNKEIEKRKEPKLIIPETIHLFLELNFKVVSFPVFLDKYNRYGIPMGIEANNLILKNFPINQVEKDNVIPLKKEISCRATNSVIQYARLHNISIEKLLKNISFSEEYLTDENNWVDCETVIKIFRNAKKLLKDDEIGVRIGEMSILSNFVGIFYILYKVFLTPVFVFKNVGKFSYLWNRVQTFSGRIVGKNTAELILSKGPVMPTKEICDFTKGSCIGMIKLWNMEVEAKEVECVREGGRYCKYLVKWKPKKSIFQKFYFFVFNNFKTFFTARKVLKERYDFFKKKSNELKIRMEENKKLAEILKQKNRRLNFLLRKKIKEFKIVYEKKLSFERELYHKEKDEIIENLTAVFAHEVKNNIEAINLMYDKISRDNLIDENRSILAQLLEFYASKVKKKLVISSLEILDKLDKYYKDIYFIVKNTQQIIKESNDFCNTILKNYRETNTQKENIKTLIKVIKQKWKPILKKYNIDFKPLLQLKKNILLNQSDFFVLVENFLTNSLNALKEYNREHKYIALKIYEKKISNNNFLIIKVIDNGCGIKKEIRNKIFEPFFSTDAHKKGLGLAFCQRVVKKNGGTLIFKSNSKETVFETRLPLL